VGNENNIPRFMEWGKNCMKREIYSCKWFIKRRMFTNQQSKFIPLRN
jgi:hypothetical protein